MLRIAMLLLTAVAFTVSSAQADAPPPRKRVVLKAKPITKAPPRPAPSGSGFYVGINGGYNWGRASFSAFPFFENSVRARNGMAGLTFGYNAQAGAVVYGIETDLDAAWLDTTNWGAPPCVACEVKLRYFGTLRGRLGYAVGQSLPYITGGLAYGKVSTTNLLIGLTDNETRIGWTVGGGVEHALLAGWSAKAEYLYFELDNANCGFIACGADVGVKLKGNLVRTGINYRF